MYLLLSPNIWVHGKVKFETLILLIGDSRRAAGQLSTPGEERMAALRVLALLLPAPLPGGARRVLQAGLSRHYTVVLSVRKGGQTTNPGEIWLPIYSLL